MANQVKRLPTNDLQPANATRNYWHVLIDPTTTVDELLNPEFWANEAHKMHKFDIIEVDAYDGSWSATLKVLDLPKAESSGLVRGYWAKVGFLVRPIRYIPESSNNDAELDSDADFEVKWNFGLRKFIVQRKSDNEIMAADFATKDAAFEWIKNYKTPVAA